MNMLAIQKARSEAKRFLAAVDQIDHAVSEREGWIDRCPREAGAVRRASMDLTRALANMRKPG